MTEKHRQFHVRDRLRSGFTLTEVMMSVCILSLVMAGTYEVYISCQKIWYSTSLYSRTSSQASMAAERFVYGDGWNPGLRAAFASTVSMVSTGSDWVLRYATPDTTNNYFYFDNSQKTLFFCGGGTSVLRAVCFNVLTASVTTNATGATFQIVVAKTEGMFSATNVQTTYVAYRN